jgi:hypothetical protein
VTRDALARSAGFDLWWVVASETSGATGTHPSGQVPAGRLRTGGLGARSAQGEPRKLHGAEGRVELPPAAVRDRDLVAREGEPLEAGVGRSVAGRGVVSHDAVHDGMDTVELTLGHPVGAAGRAHVREGDVDDLDELVRARQVAGNTGDGAFGDDEIRDCGSGHRCRLARGEPT